jgi:hypothetical protein
MDLQKTFDEIDLQWIEDCVKEGYQEDLYLDFKLINKPTLTRDDRKLFAKCVSGFANSSGGLIIWGIKANKNSEGVDCATDKSPITNLPLFISRIQSVTGKATDPTTDGIVHKPIPENGDCGFAVTLVPESIRGPHMAKLGEDRYYKRSGDSFYKLEHFDIQDMFGRRMRPELQLVYKVTRGNRRKYAQYDELEIIVYIGIANKGRGTAKSPFLALSFSSPFQLYRFGVDGNGNFGLPRLRKSRRQQSHFFGASSDYVIHPDTFIDVAAASTEIKIVSEEHLHIPELKIRYALAAEEFQTVEDLVTIPSAEIAKIIGNSA